MTRRDPLLQVAQGLPATIVGEYRMKNHEDDYESFKAIRSYHDAGGTSRITR
jgi:hypothetical protein